MLSPSSSSAALSPSFARYVRPVDKMVPIPLAPNTGDISKHLYTLFAPAFVQAHPDAWLEIAYSDPATGGINAAATFSVFEIKEATEFAEMKNRAGCNVYVGPALRQGERPISGRANDKLVVTSAYAWAEFDGEGDDKRIDARLKASGLTPALVVTTGTVPNLRAHLYFKLDGEVTPDELRAANTSLYKFLDTDKVQNTSRIMRLAGTINHSTEKKRQERGYVAELVTLRIAPDARAYSVAELIGCSGDPSKSSGNPSETSKAGRTDDELVALLEQSRKNGNWHNSIRDATASMIGKGWSDLQIKLACAPYCNEKYSDPELDALVRSARDKWHKPDTASKKGNSKTGGDPKQADILIEIAKSADLFHSPDGRGYADVNVNDHRQTLAIRAKGFRQWISRQFYTTTKSAPNSEALQSALNVIEAKAAFDGPERIVHIRVGGLN